MILYIKFKLNSSNRFVNGALTFLIFENLYSQDGLVHISKITDKYIKHPSEVLSVGDIIDCYVEEIKLDKNKVSLTMIKP